jgi:glutaredoxin-related protein
MKDCQSAIRSPFTGFTVSLISDRHADWFGFEPFNVFDKMFYNDLCVEDLVYFNNKLIEYQTEIVKFVASHKIFRNHLILRDRYFRFDYFKTRRKDPVALSESFQYYMDAICDVMGLSHIPRDVIEEDVGCHFLHHPSVFFELLEFYKLKGQINE